MLNIAQRLKNVWKALRGEQVVAVACDSGNDRQEMWDVRTPIESKENCPESNEKQEDKSSEGDKGARSFGGYVDATDVEEYLEELRRRANSGEASAQTKLGKLLLWGDITSYDPEKAMLLFKQASEQGNATAQWFLGKGYQNGVGVPENQNEAFKWVKKSAEQDYPPALNTLGNFVSLGVGTKQDFDEAARLHRKAAEMGINHAMVNLAYYYACELCDKREATKWFFKAYFNQEFSS